MGGAVRLAALFTSAILIAPITMSPVAASAQSSQPLVVEHDGVTLRGILDLPSGNLPFRVVLMIPGSGPNDRDGNNALGIFHSPFRRIAEGLVAGGFGVARLDKRGVGSSTGSAASLDDLVLDALSALDRLRTDARFDPRRIILFGHSEGGLIALEIAAHERIGGLVLAGTPGRPLHEMITDQVLTVNRQAGATDAQLAKIREIQERFYQAVRNARPGDAVTGESGQTYSAGIVQYLKSELDLDPLAFARQVTAPSLILQGGQDYNVAPDNGRLLLSALQRGNLVLIPDMSHVFTVATARTPGQLRTTPETPLHLAVIPTLVEWLRQHFGG